MKIVPVTSDNLSTIQAGQKGRVEGEDVTVEGVEHFGTIPFINCTFDGETEVFMIFPQYVSLYQEND